MQNLDNVRIRRTAGFVRRVADTHQAHSKPSCAVDGASNAKLHIRNEGITNADNVRGKVTTRRGAIAKGGREAVCDRDLVCATLAWIKGTAAAGKGRVCVFAGCRRGRVDVEVTAARVDNDGEDFGRGAYGDLI